MPSNLSDLNITLKKAFIANGEFWKDTKLSPSTDSS